MRCLDPMKNDKGVALAASVFFMGIMSMLATVIMASSSNEMKLQRLFKGSKAALYAAEGGLAEARGRLSNAGGVENQTADWRGFIGRLRAARDFGDNPGSQDPVLRSSLQDELNHIMISSLASKKDVLL